MLPLFIVATAFSLLAVSNLTDDQKIAAQNARYAFWTALVGFGTVLVTQIFKWIDDRRKSSAATEQRARIEQKIDDNTAVSKKAFSVANHFNQKLLVTIGLIEKAKGDAERKDITALKADLIALNDSVAGIVMEGSGESNDPERASDFPATAAQVEYVKRNGD